MSKPWQLVEGLPRTTRAGDGLPALLRRRARVRGPERPLTLDTTTATATTYYYIIDTEKSRDV
eukprot:4340873-Pleurochrysis_carterae.AAC.2